MTHPYAGDPVARAPAPGRARPPVAPVGDSRSEAFGAPLPPPAPLRPAGHAVFLDLDGTLAPIVDRPDLVRPDPRRTRILATLKAALGGRLAIISGRTVAEVTAITEGVVDAVAGVHGLERRTAWGDEIAFRTDPRLAQALSDFDALAAAQPGLLVEDKGAGVALHYRQAPGAGEAAGDLARRLATVTDLALQEGDMVVELRTPGPDKGEALAAFLAEPPFQGARPIFVGDDLTDEDGFRAAVAAGGFGVLVGPPRDSLAVHGLPHVEAVLDWLEAAAAGDAA